MKKYELTGEIKFHFGRKLYQIKALISFGNVEAGELGGFIEKEENLSQNGDAWVYGDARVYGNACVYGNARVCGDAWVYGDARVYGNACVCDNARVYGDACVYGNAYIKVKSDILTIGLIGSRNDTTTFFKTKEKKLMFVAVALEELLRSLKRQSKKLMEVHFTKNNIKLLLS